MCFWVPVLLHEFFLLITVAHIQYLSNKGKLQQTSALSRYGLYLVSLSSVLNRYAFFKRSILFQRIKSHLHQTALANPEFNQLDWSLSVKDDLQRLHINQTCFRSRIRLKSRHLSWLNGLTAVQDIVLYRRVKRLVNWVTLQFWEAK